MYGRASLGCSLCVVARLKTAGGPRPPRSPAMIPVLVLLRWQPDTPRAYAPDCPCLARLWNGGGVRRSQQRHRATVSRFECTVCNETKEKDQYNIDTGRHVQDTCLSCLFPTCASCGTKHRPPKRGVRKDTPNRLGREWFCEKRQCQAALKRARACAKDA